MTIDLRSDTVSRPTPEMREAMAGAGVGDDVFGDDPSVHELEERVAELLGKEAAVFVPSGTMANQIALRCHTSPGDWFIAEAGSHVLTVEGASTAGLASVAPSPIAGRRGMFTPDDVLARLPRQHSSMPDLSGYVPKLVWLENTHNGAGGVVWPLDLIVAVARTARAEGLAMHLDGARLWNASAASGVGEADYADHFDSVSVCFSKGLGAPVGSALVGGRDLIARARRFRSAYGGGMRQAGIIAAGALHALEHHRVRLGDDHANARALGEGLATIDGIEIDLETVETNIVKFRLKSISAGRFIDLAAEHGVLMLPLGPDTVRAVTCLDVSSADIATAIEEIRTIELGS